MKCAVDNVAILAIEDILVAGFVDIFSPSMVLHMDADLVRHIAAESQEDQETRKQLSRTLSILRRGALTCKQYAVRGGSGKPRHFARRATFGN